MSFLSQFDPTSSDSAFGSFTRSAITALPGGSATLGVVDRYNTANRSTTTNRAGSSTAAPAPAVTPWYRSTGVLLVGAVVGIGLVLVLVFRRR